MEDLLDQAYEQFMSKKEGSAKQRKRAKRLLSEDILEVRSSCDCVGFEIKSFRT